jgi:arabinogalactan endo-1,4-beta-galactosidase
MRTSLSNFERSGRKLLFSICIMLYVFVTPGCSKSNFNVPDTVNQAASKSSPLSVNSIIITNPGFLRGADVSFVTQMENGGNFFFNTTDQQDLFTVLKERNINTIRLRIWVNPAGPSYYNGINDVIAKAVRAKNAGMKLLIDFHYSDTWADPGHQTKPVAWSGYTLAALQTAVASHTTACLDSLIAHGVTPTYVQVGNETDDGMLWPTGQISAGNMVNYAALYKAGYNAVKAVNSSIKVMVHFSKGYDNTACRNVLDGLITNGAVFDIIGLSVYPSSNYTSVMTSTNTNMQDLVTRYGKDLMIAECGYPQSDPKKAQLMINTLQNNIVSLSGNHGLGVYYWEPESYNHAAINKSCFSATGKNPTLAFDAFSLVNNPGFEVDTIGTQTPTGWVTAGSNPEANYTEATAHSGSFRLTHYKNAAFNVSTSQTITGLANGTYTFQAWVVSPYAETSNYMFAKDFGGTQISTNIPVAGGWQKLQVTNINVTNGQCTIGFYTSGAKYCSMDDIEFFKQ